MVGSRRLGHRAAGPVAGVARRGGHRRRAGRHVDRRVGTVRFVAPAADLGPALDARASAIPPAGDRAAGRDRRGRRPRRPRAGQPGRTELDLLLDELRRAVGLGGRDRPHGSGAERARVNVARSLRRAISAIEASLPELGAHLRVSVRTGRYCAYQPEPAAALDWTVDLG
jgi:hypothetical protein